VHAKKGVHMRIKKKVLFIFILCTSVVSYADNIDREDAMFTEIPSDDKGPVGPFLWRDKSGNIDKDEG
jgi:hypothetical protein